MALSSSLKNIAKSVGSTTKSLANSSTGAYKSFKSNSGSGGSSILGSLLSSSGSKTNTSRTTGSSGSSLLGSLLNSTGGRAYKTGPVYTNTGSRSSSSGILSSLVSGLSSKASEGINKYTSTKDGSKSSGTILSSLFSSFGNTKSKTNVSNAITNLLNNTKARTGGSSIISSIFNRNTGTTSGSSGTGVSKISNLNVFGGLKNLISGAKSNITGGDGTTKVNPIGLLGLSTTLGSTSQRIQESFNNWKSKLSLLPMSGTATKSSTSAANQMTGLFGRFAEFSNNLSNKLTGRSNEISLLDKASGSKSVDAEAFKNINWTRNGQKDGITDSGAQQASIMYSTLQKEGFNDAQIAGIMGNAFSESGFNNNSSVMDTNGRYSHGCFMNNDAGYNPEFKKYCQQNGYNTNSTEAQTLFVAEKMKKDEQFMNATDSEYGARIAADRVRSQYENSGYGKETRKDNAAAIYNTIS